MILKTRQVIIMKYLFSLMILGLVVLAVSAQTRLPSPSPSTAGETAALTIYPRFTQIGTRALRTIRDRSSRVMREVFYTTNRQDVEVPDENDLRVQLIKVYYYDEAGRVDHIEHWDRGSRLDRVEQNKYDSSGELTRKWFVEADGVRRYEMRFSGQKKFADLHFDDTGTYLTSLCGHLVPDIDLAHGWGKTKDGMACGITLSAERGRFDEISVWVNIKNVAVEMVHVDTLPPPSFELLDAGGNLVSQRDAGSKNNFQLERQMLESNEAGYVYPAYKLADYYDSLPPGKYTIRIRQLVSERTLVLESNEVTFVIVKSH
jgi:hypothetical protein